MGKVTFTRSRWLKSLATDESLIKRVGLFVWIFTIVPINFFCIGSLEELTSMMERKGGISKSYEYNMILVLNGHIIRILCSFLEKQDEE